MNNFSVRLRDIFRVKLFLNKLQPPLTPVGVDFR